MSCSNWYIDVEIFCPAGALLIIPEDVNVGVAWCDTKL